jgi:hypothetical protein
MKTSRQRWNLLHSPPIIPARRRRTVKFLFDANLPPALARWLVSEGKR